MKRRVTIKDVAREAQVSVATISYVLNNKESISKETKDRVIDAIKKLNYIPDMSARSLVSSSSKLIGVVIPQTEPGSRLMFENPFYSSLLSSIEFTARANGYHILISGTDADESYLELAQQRKLDGIIIIGMYPDSFYNELKKSQIPIVLVDSYCNDHYFHSVQINDRYGGYIATKYLLDHGHRNIAYMSGVLKENGVNEMRYEGYLDALREYGAPIHKKYVLSGTVGFASGIELADKMVNTLKDVTAVFCSADIMAVGAIKQLTEKGIKVPQDISVIGFDNVDIANYTAPGLTTVCQDIFRKGETAAELIMKSIEKTQNGKQEIILPIEIFERGSVTTR